MANVRIELPGLNLKNPIIPASGTAGFGEELANMYDLSLIGGIMIKATSVNPKRGNKTPRVAETYGGMLNSIGLENPGLEVVANEKLPFLAQFDLEVIANICGDSIDEYVKVAYEISRVDNVCALELNISCPNVHGGGIPFGADEETVYQITKAVKEASIKPVYVKLSPNVTDIVKMADQTILVVRTDTAFSSPLSRPHSTGGAPLPSGADCPQRAGWGKGFPPCRTP